MFLISWLLFPLTLFVLSLGVGLLVRRLAGGVLPGALVLPMGFAGLVVVVGLVTYLDATAELAGPAAALLALAGIVLAFRAGGRPPRPPRSAWAPAAAAASPFVAIAAPVVLTGRPGFTGYGRIVDLAFQLDLAVWFSSRGRELPEVVTSSYTEVIGKTVNVGYPGGGQAALGSVTSLLGIEAIWAWQPFLAWMGAMLGLSLYVLLGRAIRSTAGRALAAGVAAQATILYSYTLTSAIKELGAALFIALAMAVFAARSEDARAARSPVPLAVAFAAAFYAFSLGAIPWLGILAAAAIAIELVLVTARERVSRAVNWVAVGALAFVLAAPAALASVKLAPVATSGGPIDLGNLAAPVPLKAVAGVWLTPDHRYPLVDGGHAGLTDLLILVVLALAIAGVVSAVVRRDLALAAAALAGAIGLLYIIGNANPWVELKAIAITAPLTLALAFAGAAALGRIRHVPPWVAALAGCAVGAGVLAGNALVYNGTTLAPYERLADLERVGRRHADTGPTLYPAFEEYAEYLLRDADGRSLVNPGTGKLPTRRDAPADPFGRDLDDLQPAALDLYRQIIRRRDPVSSRPPSDWRLVETTRFHEVWHRVPGRPEIVARFPVGGPYGPNTRERCAAVGRALRSAGPGASVAYVRAPAVTQYGTEQLARGPGRARLDVMVPSDGRYRVWLRGSFGRRVTVAVDGRPVGGVRWRQNYPGQQERIGTLELEAGRHVAEITRGGGSLLPGWGNDIATDGSKTRVQPITFEPVAPRPPVQTATGAQAMRACNDPRTLDWIEVVRRAAAG